MYISKYTGKNTHFVRARDFSLKSRKQRASISKQKNSSSRRFNDNKELTDSLPIDNFLSSKRRKGEKLQMRMLMIIRNGVFEKKEMLFGPDTITCKYENFLSVLGHLLLSLLF